ncbi:MAG: glucose-6-phosphate isomerase, partial [Spirochaetia bacterium]
MKNIEYKNLDTSAAYGSLLKRTPPLPLSLQNESRIEECETPAAGGLAFNWASQPIGEEELSLLAEIAQEQQLLEKYHALAAGERMNTGEDRRVLHHLTRGGIGERVVENGTDLGAFYTEQRDKIADFAKKVHSGKISGSTGKPFNTVVQIGIGGSDLGPRALYLALEGLYTAHQEPKNESVRRDPGAPVPGTHKMKARFISNVDPDDAAAVLSEVDPERTLFILVSKSGTTQETLTNREIVIRFMKEHGDVSLDPSKHMAVVTASTSPLATSGDYLESFFIDDYIGGRYSSTSAVGGAVLSLTYGPEVFLQLLEGAHQADMAALNPQPENNASLLDALIGIYHRNVLGYPVTAVLPYSQPLHRFPAHLQQLDMESNGKRVNRRGEPLAYSTGPIVFGEPGTNGQHSFYQLLHQGTEPVPLQFIGFRENQMGMDTEFEGSTSRTKLNANLAAQIVAFSEGKDDKDPNKRFPGGRPSSLIYGEKLTPLSLGALLAHYENKIMFQGFCCNINSFDQEGMHLGKKLTSRVDTPVSRTAFF